MKLNMATRHSHAEVDEPWLDLLRPTVTRADYLGQLVRTYGFVAPFEGACKYTPDLARVLDVQQTRAGLIAQDLLALGLSPSQVASVPQCHSITTFRSVAEALGWSYAIERSTLLQDGIRRHLLELLPEVEPACTYLASYDGRIGEQWQTFARLLDRVGAKHGAADEIIAAAHAGFDTVKTWFRTTRSEARSA
jgi:heme oxygenase